MQAPTKLVWVCARACVYVCVCVCVCACILVCIRVLLSIHPSSTIPSPAGPLQMHADNLAVCMSQSLFTLPSSIKGPNAPPLRRTGSFRRHHDVKITQQEFASRKEITDSLVSMRLVNQNV